MKIKKKTENFFFNSVLETTKKILKVAEHYKRGRIMWLGGGGDNTAKWALQPRSILIYKL